MRFIFVAAALLVASPAHAADLFGGLYVHDVKTPLDKAGLESGGDVLIGYRGGNIAHTPIRPYAFAALHTKGKTNYAAIGLSAKFGEAIYVRPGLGLAVHTGSIANHEIDGNRIAFGSRILFEPEMNVGAKVNDRISLEASWIHMSHSQLFSRQNPGIDNLGVRLNLAL
jgi:lipid A 3-O-deacylase